jgi:adenosine kinase
VANYDFKGVMSIFRLQQLSLSQNNFLNYLNCFHLLTVPMPECNYWRSRFLKFARHCLDFGVKALYITLDEYGCALYFKNVSGKIEEHFIKRIQVDQVVDTTGCGDSFAGGLAFGYLKTRDYVKACYYGNAMGAQRCTGTELAIYKDIEETEQIIAAAYGHP